MIRQRQKWYLLEWRKHRELTQPKLGERIGKSKNYISELEHGAPYNQDLLEALAEALDCEVWELLHRNPLLPDPVGIDSIAETIRRIPIDERERALRAAQNMLETFAAPPPKPTVMDAVKKRRKAG